MGLFDFLKFGKRTDPDPRASWPSDPTASWIADPSRGLTVDFGNGTLSGVTPGQPFDELKWLGPADSRGESDPYDTAPDKAFWYRYAQSGLVVTNQRSQLCRVQIEFPQYAAGIQFAGDCILNGEQLPLPGKLTVADVTSRLGKPKDRGVVYGNNDFMDLVLTYQFDCDIRFIFPLPDCCTEEEEAADTHVLNTIVLSKARP